MKVRLITDSACDLSIDYVQENNIEVVPLTVNINGEFIPDDLGQTLKHEDFYKMIKEGAMPSTAQVNVGDFFEVFKKCVDQGDAIIYIGLSSSLSGTYNSSTIARQMILEENPNAIIHVIDSLSVSVGEGLLVYHANEMLKDEVSIESVVNFVEENKRKIIHAITVNDLNHLKRGGRISGTVAAVGSLLGIKPTLKIDDEGNVIPGDKIKGRKKALKYLVQELKEKAINPEEQVIFICHADCLSEAEDVKKMILEEVKVKDILINSIGAVIGTHGGPGTLALVFKGDKR
ncbi:DegV family protein [Clostridium sp. CTA-7]